MWHADVFRKTILAEGFLEPPRAINTISLPIHVLEGRRFPGRNEPPIVGATYCELSRFPRLKPAETRLKKLLPNGEKSVHNVAFQIDPARFTK